MPFVFVRRYYSIKKRNDIKIVFFLDLFFVPYDGSIAESFIFCSDTPMRMLAYHVS